MCGNVMCCLATHGNGAYLIHSGGSAEQLFLGSGNLVFFYSTFRMDMFLHDVLSDHMGKCSISHPFMRLKRKTYFLVVTFSSFLFFIYV